MSDYVREIRSPTILHTRRYFVVFVSRERSATVINCITPGETNTFNSGQVVLRIDDEVVENNKVLFSYRPNPTFTSVRPNYTIARYIHFGMWCGTEQ